MPAATSFIKHVINRLIESCARLAESHPYIWKLAWEAVHRIPALLPHDKSYYAFRHFIACRPQGLFLDVGANDGISILSFRKFDANYRILALEPNPVLEPALKKIQGRDPALDYRMVGAGAVPAKLEFFVPIYRGIPLHTFTSSARENVEAAVEQSFGKSVLNATRIEKFKCDVIRLDDLRIDPTIVKIDAEGFDYSVLLGLAETIARARPFVVTEIDSDESANIKSYFDKLDYVLLIYNIVDDCFENNVPSRHSAGPATSGHRNIFAVPRELVEALPSCMTTV